MCLRGRCAVLLYADNGTSDVDEREIADVIALAPDVANALGRIILQRKREAAARKEHDPNEISASLAPPPNAAAKGDPASRALGATPSDRIGPARRGALEREQEARQEPQQRPRLEARRAPSAPARCSAVAARGAGSGRGGQRRVRRSRGRGSLPRARTRRLPTTRLRRRLPMP